MSEGSRVGVVLGCVALLAAGTALLAGCAESSSDVSRVDLTEPGARVSAAIPGVNVSLPPITGKERPARRAGAAGEPLAIGAGGNQTALIHCETEQIIPGALHEKWHRAHLIVLDGPLATGTYEVTPQNGRLIEFSNYRPARQPYVGLEGKIEVLRISGGTVLANCSVRNVIKMSGEPVYALRGLYRFQISTGETLSPGVCGLQVAPGAGAMPAAPEEGTPPAESKEK
jgi:hypothetical protein